MRATTTPMALVVIALAGCAGEPPTAPMSPAGTYTGQAIETGMAAQDSALPRPIKGPCEAETEEVVPISPTVIRRISFGTCQLSHLGRTTLHSVADSNLVTLEQTGEHTLTAANGDALFATSAGTATLIPPSTLQFTGVTTISGGTGRFANARGVMDVAGTSDLSGARQRSSFTYDGWIAY